MIRAELEHGIVTYAESIGDMLEKAYKARARVVRYEWINN